MPHIQIPIKTDEAVAITLSGQALLIEVNANPFIAAGDTPSIEADLSGLETGQGGQGVDPEDEEDADKNDTEDG